MRNLIKHCVGGAFHVEYDVNLLLMLVSHFFCGEPAVKKAQPVQDGPAPKRSRHVEQKKTTVQRSSAFSRLLQGSLSGDMSTSAAQALEITLRVADEIDSKRGEPEYIVLATMLDYLTKMLQEELARDQQNTRAVIILALEVLREGVTTELISKSDPIGASALFAMLRLLSIAKPEELQEIAHTIGKTAEFKVRPQVKETIALCATKMSQNSATYSAFVAGLTPTERSLISLVARTYTEGLKVPQVEAFLNSNLLDLFQQPELKEKFKPMVDAVKPSMMLLTSMVVRHADSVSAGK